MAIDESTMATRWQGLGYQALTATTLDQIVAEQVQGIWLILTTDPKQVPEVFDYAVILPEVWKHLGHPDTPIYWATPNDSRSIAQRYGVLKFPALLRLRPEGYVGALISVLDWPEMVERVAYLAQAPVSRPPSIGIAVRANHGSCQA